MSTDQWHDFLASQGAQWDSDGHSYFQQAYADPDEDKTYLVDLSYLSGLMVEGPDACSFLQGQVTADMNELSPTHSVPGAHCTVKGRMLFSYRAVDLSDEDNTRILLVLPADLVEDAREALAKFAVFSKANLYADSQWQLLGLWGPDAESRLKERHSPVPEQQNGVECGGNEWFIRVGPQRFVVLTSGNQAPDIWRAWQSNCEQAGYWQWQLAGIREGWGEVLPGTEDLFLPQMLNFDITGGVNFKKGCYVGQEVVARMQYRGKLKRHMRRAQGTGEPPAPGEPLHATGARQPVGQVVTAAPLDSDTFECLVVVTDTAFESEQVSVDEENTRNLRFLPLPYAITNQRASE